LDKARYSKQQQTFFKCSEKNRAEDWKCIHCGETLVGQCNKADFKSAKSLHMKPKDILILVKTYPEISRKYTETVCSAGVLADTKKLVRLYPIRYRYLTGKDKFSKYQWIKSRLRKSQSDTTRKATNWLEILLHLGRKLEHQGVGKKEKNGF